MRDGKAIAIDAPIKESVAWIIEITGGTITLSHDRDLKGFGLKSWILPETEIEEGLDLKEGMRVYVEFEEDIAVKISSPPFGP